MTGTALRLKQSSLDFFLTQGKSGSCLLSFVSIIIPHLQFECSHGALNKAVWSRENCDCLRRVLPEEGEIRTVK